MKKWIAGLAAFFFVIGMGLWEIGVQAGSGHASRGVLLAKKDKDKEGKELKEKEEQLEAKAKELNAKEEALKKKEEELKKWEDSLKQRSKKARRPVQQGAGAGLQQPPAAPAGFSPKTTNPQPLTQPNAAAPKSPLSPVTASPPRQ